jgi:hypothetical protein
VNGPRILAPVILVASLVASCGAGPTFPTPGHCPSPTPLPARVPSPASRAPQGENEYRQILFAGIDQLTKLTADFKTRWPGTGFSAASAFRTDFATYVDQSTCVAQGMLGQVPPAAADADFVDAFDAAVHDFVTAEARARDGVQARNATVYRDWNTSIDGAINTIRDTFRRFPQAPFGPGLRRTPTN